MGRSKAAGLDIHVTLPDVAGRVLLRSTWPKTHVQEKDTPAMPEARVARQQPAFHCVFQQQPPVLSGGGSASPSRVLQVPSTPCWRLLSPVPCIDSCTAWPWLLFAAIPSQLMAEQQGATKGRGRRAWCCPSLLGEPKGAELRASASIYP